MNEKKNNDEEYYFDEPQHEAPTEEVYTPESKPEPAAKPPSSKLRSLLIIIGMVVILFAVYKAIGVMFTSNDADEIKPVATQVAQPVVSNAVPAESVAQKLSDIQMMDKQSKTELTKVGSVVTGMQDDMSNLSTTLRNINTNLQTLNAQNIQEHTNCLARFYAYAKSLQPLNGNQ